MIRTNEEVIEAVRKFRETWSTTGGRKLSLNGSLGETDTRIAAYEKSYAASIQRALKNPLKINTHMLKEDDQFKADFVMKLADVLYADEGFDFEQWERNLASLVRNHFREAGLSNYTYGNAQKWINLSIKYLLSSPNIDPLLPCFKMCYIPIDRIIQRKAHEQLHIDYLHVDGRRVSFLPSWGNCDNIDDIIDFENRVREATNRLGYYSPLMWEIENWNNNI